MKRILIFIIAIYYVSIEKYYAIIDRIDLNYYFVSIDLSKEWSQWKD